MPFARVGLRLIRAAFVDSCGALCSSISLQTASVSAGRAKPQPGRIRCVSFRFAPPFCRFVSFRVIVVLTASRFDLFRFVRSAVSFRFVSFRFAGGVVSFRFVSFP